MAQFFQALTAFCALYGAAALALGVINFLLSRRSQVDAWCNANPRLAGVMKLLRFAGVDPWMGVQALSLIVRGKLPDNVERRIDMIIPPPPLIVLAMLCAFGAQACGAAQQVPKVAKTCAAPIAKLDVEYAVELLRVCPGLKLGTMSQADIDLQCPEFAQLEQRYAMLYDSAGEECADAAADGGKQ